MPARPQYPDGRVKGMGCGVERGGMIWEGKGRMGMGRKARKGDAGTEGWKGGGFLRTSGCVLGRAQRAMPAGTSNGL
eukprot:3229326-Rhodomonas_salina.2